MTWSFSCSPSVSRYSQRPMPSSLLIPAVSSLTIFLGLAVFFLSLSRPVPLPSYFPLPPAPLALFIPPSTVVCLMLLFLAFSLVPDQTWSQMTWFFSCSPSVSLFSFLSLLSLLSPRRRCSRWRSPPQSPSIAGRSSLRRPTLGSLRSSSSPCHQSSSSPSSWRRLFQPCPCCCPSSSRCCRCPRYLWTSPLLLPLHVFRSSGARSPQVLFPPSRP